jgi:3'-phosphoadenosine 5'-phosphosulfate sulfotransferase (PAPS reductase)/FAD synthetase
MPKRLPPVKSRMLYSIGKDSAVMLHLAMKAFYPPNRLSR